MRGGSGHTEELFIIQIKGFIKTSSSKGLTIPKRMNFHKIAWEGGGSYAHKLCFANVNLLPTISIFFSKNLEGGQESSGTFPKNHPFWFCQAPSLFDVQPVAQAALYPPMSIWDISNKYW